ncbi:sporozoite surface 2 precursor [Fusarium subglutinans]|uniref:Sporozoite surface 2 n=1 Tax=Gibberella subglutinans TaxID=42677 RepID=A0A8H5PGU5_GIBSU|nr:sporozoite surface 2 precursor [Fusarium subglutinans]KAF5596106.1 sporozoite surface 2 precursor [Fusarium subglutinans]
MYSFNTVALVALAGFAAVEAVIVSPAPQPTGVKNGTVTTTSVYDVYTTVCTGPTSFHLGGKDYVVTEPCTLTITDCPCTVTETHPAGPTWIPGKPAKTTGPQAPVSTKPAKGTDVPKTPVVVAGAGAVQVGLGLAAMLGLIALLKERSVTRHLLVSLQTSIWDWPIFTAHNAMILYEHSTKTSLRFSSPTY